MNEGDAIDLVQSAIWMVVIGAGPCVGAAMAVGVVIALLQALTQIQEMTLTFVPKMIAVFVAASLTASFVGGKFSIFTQSVYARIEQGYNEREAGASQSLITSPRASEAIHDRPRCRPLLDCFVARNDGRSHGNALHDP